MKFVVFLKYCISSGLSKAASPALPGWQQARQEYMAKYNVQQTCLPPSNSCGQFARTATPQQNIAPQKVSAPVAWANVYAFW
jgi:hypothetical protein